MHRVLKQALGQAVKWEMLVRNPADAVDPPKVDWKPMQTYDLPQTVGVIEAVRSTPLLVPVALAVLCGLRRGEICALRWRNVDLIGGQISVVGEYRADQGRAAVQIPQERQRAHRGAICNRGRRTTRAPRQARPGAPQLGIGLSDDDLVIGHADGSMVSPIYISQLWARMIAKTRLARLRFHDLRHAHATHLLANGVHPKVASERLGHSKVGITLDLYSHVIPGMQEDAAAMVDRALSAARDKARK